VHALANRQPADSVVVFASDYPGAAAFDAAQPYPVIRPRTGLLLPTPRVRARATALARTYACTSAWFGAAAPLGLLAPALRSAGVEQIVATTHGHEVGWTLVPCSRSLLRRIGSNCDVVTYLGEYTRRRLARSLGPRATLEQLTPGVDIATFHPEAAGDGVAGAIGGRAIRARYGLGDRPVVVCVSRLVPRKGQDALIRALPAIKKQIPDAALLLVGGGPYRATLEKLVDQHGVQADVVFTGAVSDAELPAHFAAGDIFAMPCRTRRGGADVEGLGIVYLEASATGLPVIAGNSGGAPDAVQHGTTGYVVDGRQLDAITARIVELLADAELRERMGAAGRAWVVRDWQWDAMAARLRALLEQ
jgi:phosphatidylinositol alpha-1,6-mannosyltransferase